jgi:uncharacterized membrane protein (UPF0127 family)
MRKIQIQNTTLNLSKPLKGYLYHSFFERFKGLMFRKELAQDECVILDEGNESLLNASIHMFFMNFDIAAIWIDKDFKVVDLMLARKWKPFYAPRKPARYIIEAQVIWLKSFRKNDQLNFIYG